MDIIKAPFSDEQVDSLNKYQKEGRFHPFTCCSPEEISDCLRAGRMEGDKYIQGSSDGLLVATNDGWVCPCGKYKQDWAHEFMTNKNLLKDA